MILFRLLGPGPGDRRGRRRSIRHCDLFPSRRAIRLRASVDGISHHPLHDCDPTRECADRKGHRQGPRCQRDGGGTALAGAGAGFSFGHREHFQHRRRHCRDGGGAVAHHWRAQSRACPDFCRRLDPAPGIRPLSPLRAGPEIPDACTVFLHSHRLHGEDSMGHSAAGDRVAEGTYQRRLFPDDGRRARHHNQPLSVLLGLRRKSRR